MELLLAPIGLALLVLPAWTVAQRIGFERWTLAVLAATVLAWAELVVVALVLSAVDAFDRWSLLAAQTVILLAVAAVARGVARPFPRIADLRCAAAALRAAGAEYRVLAGLVGGALALNLLLALVVAPNNPDALSYHLSRAAYWVQEGSVLHFHGASARQAAMPPNGEIPLAWLIALTDRDVLVGLVQYAAYGLAMIGVYEGGRVAGFGHRPSLFAALVFGCLPQALLQASTTQNDLTTTVAVVTAVVFGARGLRGGRKRELAVAALALGLAVGTKITAVIALPAIALALLAIAWGRAPARRVAGFAGAAVLATAVLGAPNYVQNHVDFGNVLAPPEFIRIAGGVRDRDRLSVYPPDGERLHNLVRMSWSSFVETTPVDAPWLQERLSRAGEALGSFAVTPGPTAGRSELTFDFEVSATIDEDETGYGLLGLLVLLPCWAYALVRSSRDARTLALAAAGALLTLALVFRYSAYGGRIVLPYVALAAPLVAVAARHFWLRVGIVAIAASTVLPILLLNPTKPLLPMNGTTVFELSREQQLTRRNETLRPQLQAIRERVPDDAPLGIRLAENELDYPLFGPRFERRVLRVVPGEDDERRGIVGGHPVKAIFYYPGFDPPAGSRAIELPGDARLVIFR